MELIIAYYCAPALAGIKASNIISCCKSRFKNIHRELSALNNELNVKDIYIKPLYESDKNILIMVYRGKTLGKTLNLKHNADFLNQYGYEDCTSIDEYVGKLKERLKKDNFPHEIGVFLGYPLHDIYGYLYKENEECVLCGEWKVYENMEDAKKLFHRFNACRIALSKKVLCGKSLAEVF